MTVLDLDAEGVRARLRRRCPALVAGEIGVNAFVPPRFRSIDLEKADLATVDLREDAGQPDIPVTAWAICTGDDDLNLRVGLDLHIAIQTRRLYGAPVHIRVCSGHGVSTHSIGTDGITLSRTFGSLKDGIDQTTALDDDPDGVSKRLNRAYMEAKRVSPGVTPDGKAGMVTKAEAEADWKTLSPSKRSSNRRAHRHAPMKLADLGFEWRGADDGALPRLAKDDRTPYHTAHQDLHARDFLSDPQDGSAGSRLFRAMVNEHDRWAIDRALDGWTPAQMRDESRLLHENMVPWDRLGPQDDREEALRTRAYDAVLIRALIDDETAAGRQQAHPAKTVLISVPNSGSVRASEPVSDWKHATELRLRLPPGDTRRPDKTTIDDRGTLVEVLRSTIRHGVVCRVTLLFPAPPVDKILTLANGLAKAACPGVSVHSAWLWRAGDDHTPRLEAEFRDLPHEV